MWHTGLYITVSIHLNSIGSMPLGAHVPTAVQEKCTQCVLLQHDSSGMAPNETSLQPRLHWVLPRKNSDFAFSLALAIGTSVNVIPWPQVEAWGLPCWKHRAWPWACTNHQLCEGSHLQVRTPDDQTLTCEPWQHRTCPANSLQSVNSKLQIKCLY